jgi:hypothetical protein
LGASHQFKRSFSRPRNSLKRIEATLHCPEITTKGLLLYFGFECIGVLPDKKERLELKRIKKFFTHTFD